MKPALLRLVVWCTCIFLLVSPLWCEVERRETGNLVLEDVPLIPQRIQDRLNRYQNTRSASFESWLPDSSGIIVSTRFGETAQLHLITQPAGMRTQLTFFSEPVTSAWACPDVTRSCLIFRKDIGGSELYQLFLLNRNTGEPRMLTDGQSRNGGALWSNDGQRFAFTSTKRNGKDYDIYVWSFERNEPEMVMQTEGAWSTLDWGHDDNMLLLQRYISINESYLYTLDLQSRQITQINPAGDKISYGDAQWSKDARGIYMTSDQGSEFTRLRYFDLQTKQYTELSSDIPWNVEGFDLSDDGKYLAFSVNENGNSKLYLLDLATKERTPISGIAHGLAYGAFSPDSQSIAITVSNAKTPSDVFVYDIANGQLTRWTYSETGGLNTSDFSLPELIDFPTFDEVNGNPRMLSVFYYKPKTENGKPAPVVIYIHGGPESQYRPGFNPMVQFYCQELGIAVLAPNVRGSNGYGKSFLKLDNWQKREDSVKDIGALLDWIETRPELDDSRVVVYGGSYGGYMVLASMTHFNDRLRAGIEIVGISNFVTFLKNTRDYRRDLRRAEYGDERVEEMTEFLQHISPSNNADKITKPMLIAQGLNDPRVPASESEQIVAAIRNNGGTVWYILAKDEGHGFRKKSNRDLYYQSVVLFLEKTLLQPEK